MNCPISKKSNIIENLDVKEGKSVSYANKPPNYPELTYHVSYIPL